MKHKKKLTKEQIKKQWVKSLRIWKMIGRKVRIVKIGEQYVVQKRTYLGLFPGWSDWEELNTFSTFKKAVQKRNMHIVLVVIRELGLQCEFVRRRKINRKLKFGF